MKIAAALAFVPALTVGTQVGAQVSQASETTQSEILVALFSEFCLATRGVADQVSARANQAKLKPPQRSHHKLNFLDSHDQAVWRGVRNGVSYTLISRSTGFCQVVSGPPAGPLSALADAFGQAHKARPIFRNPTVKSGDGERREVLGFRLKVDRGRSGRSNFLAQPMSRSRPSPGARMSSMPSP